jgi:predicted transcriptional regulator of viral defense system
MGTNMPKGNYLTALLRSPKTVFTTKDIALLWREAGSGGARVRLNYFVKKGDLYRIRKGLYAKSEIYNKLELATRILTPSYVSFETVLAKEGLIFQYYEPIFIASYATREMTIGGQTYFFRKIKDKVLINPTGIEHTGETSIARRERAFLDILYVNTDYHFDNLRSLNWESVFEMLPLYDNQKMAKRVNRIYKKANQ